MKNLEIIFIAVIMVLILLLLLEYVHNNKLQGKILLLEIENEELTQEISNEEIVDSTITDDMLAQKILLFNAYKYLYLCTLQNPLFNIELQGRNSVILKNVEGKTLPFSSINSKTPLNINEIRKNTTSPEINFFINDRDMNNAELRNVLANIPEFYGNEEKGNEIRDILLNIFPDYFNEVQVG